MEAAASHAPNLFLLACIWISVGIIIGTPIGLGLGALLAQANEPTAVSEDVKLQRLHKSLTQQIEHQRMRKAERRQNQRSPALFELDGVPATERIGNTGQIPPRPAPPIPERFESAGGEFLGPKAKS